ncbi:hypothetical protein E0Z10_g7044 [Xylaria hypoxylon]|uniref:Uncharacterized protein n=1 Tax=Xylaria hypoxylon TaxID=37992 RepID=A0A4Z0YRD2_9PEZI|nr:hypothetical protein E0Z10_g7044 [Xylaria hypoxylon]
MHPPVVIGPGPAPGPPPPQQDDDDGSDGGGDDDDDDPDCMPETCPTTCAGSDCAKGEDCEDDDCVQGGDCVGPNCTGVAHAKDAGGSSASTAAAVSACSAIAPEAVRDLSAAPETAWDPRPNCDTGGCEGEDCDPGDDDDDDDDEDPEFCTLNEDLIPNVDTADEDGMGVSGYTGADSNSGGNVGLGGIDGSSTGCIDDDVSPYDYHPPLPTGPLDPDHLPYCFRDHNDSGRWEMFTSDEAEEVADTMCYSKDALEPDDVRGLVFRGPGYMIQSVTWAQDQGGCSPKANVPLDDWCYGTIEAILISCDFEREGEAGRAFGGGVVEDSEDYGCVTWYVGADLSRGPGARIGGDGDDQAVADKIAETEAGLPRIKTRKGQSVQDILAGLSQGSGGT